MSTDSELSTLNPQLSTSFATANDILLAPYSLDNNALQQVFGQILMHKVDYADLYFQYNRSEGWSLEEGIVKSGSFNIDQGVGVRAVAGDKTAFAYSDDISLTALTSAAQATRAIARQGAAGATQVAKRGKGRDLYVPRDPLASLDDAAKVALLEKIERARLALDLFEQRDLGCIIETRQRVPRHIEVAALTALRDLRRTGRALACDGSCGLRRRSQRGKADIVGIGKRGLVAGHRAHADALVDIEAAGLDDAFLEAPTFAAVVLEVEVGVIDLVHQDLAEHLLQCIVVERVGGEQDIVRGRERSRELGVES